MIARIVAFATHHSRGVLVAAIVLAACGWMAWGALARDAIPDLSDPRIVLVAEWMGHAAPDVAEEVTQVLTGSLGGVHGATAVRGSSMSGMAYVDVVFASTADLEVGRQEILERVASVRARLPETARVEVGPVAASTGWVFEYVLTDPHREHLHRPQSAVAMRSFQDTVLGPALASLSGVAEVASVGGGLQQIQVEAAPDRLRSRGVAFSDVLSTVRDALATHRVAGIADLEALALARPASPDAARVGDVAQVRLTEDMPAGIADLGGVQPAVGGIVVARRDADVPRLIADVERVLEEARPRLPQGVELAVAYDRRDVIDHVGRTLLRVLAEEVAVVVLVVFVFLLHGRSALLPLLTLPVVLLLTFAAMWLLRVPATIMSLGGVGIALGMAVDADVVALEACHRRLKAGASPPDRRTQLTAAAGSVAPAILITLVIAGLSFLPVFAFSGETGRLLRPLALGKTLVIAASALVTLTLAPALRDRLVRGRVRPELENPLTRSLVRVYGPFVHFALRRPVLTIVTATLAVASCLPVVSRLGGDFLPRVDEGDLLFMPTTLPGLPADQAAAELARQDRALRRFPEVAVVFGKVGRADSATDPAPYSMAETTIRLRPRGDWPPVPRARWYSPWAPAPLRRVLSLLWPEATPRTPAELVGEMEKVVRSPGWIDAWTSPARARMDMMSTGVRTPVGIRIVAATPSRLDAVGAAVRAMAANLPGTRSAVLDSLGGEPSLRFTPAELRDVEAETVRSTVDALVTGGELGELVHDGRRLPVRIALDVQASTSMPGNTEGVRGPTDQLREATVRARSGAVVPLALLGRVDYVQRPSLVRAERGEPVSYVHVDLDGDADVLGYVERGRLEVDRMRAAGQLQLEPGERIEWTGEYDLLAAGQRRLRWIVPLVVFSMLALLYLQFRSLTEAMLVLVSVPFALVGSVWTLYLLGYTMSAPVWVGLLSVVGLAMQTGVVMVVYIDEAFHRRLRAGRLRTREDIVAAHAEGTIRRLRPKLMTITTMAAGLLPLLWADGPGAEIMRCVAAPMVGGLVTSAFLTLEVLPVLYTLWRHSQLRRAERSGVPLRHVVGEPPPWARG